MGKLQQYYNKFNEAGRLTRRHGIVEYETTMFFLKKELERLREEKRDGVIRVIDVGTGSGRYALALKELGCQVTAVDPVTHHINDLRKIDPEMDMSVADARDLSAYMDASYDIVLFLGPLYHLISEVDRIKALQEARRLLASNGRIFAAYCMNEYSILTYGFKEGHIQEAMDAGKISDDYKCISGDEELYYYARVEDMSRLSEKVGLCRDYVFSPDGAANYIREELKEMSEETFNIFLDYVKKTAMRPELLGAAFHTVDVLKRC